MGTLFLTETERMKQFLYILLLIVVFTLTVNAQYADPKREFRGAWIATVQNLDWPAAAGNSSSKQKADLIEIFDALEYAGINVAVFQIRPACDAFYQSNYEPWSFWLTGTQGRSPGYDPLAFAIEQAHSRGMELHAWFNPYRAEVSIGDFDLDSTHVVKQHPEWILTFNKVNKRLLDPGVPDVRDYVTTVIMDVVTRYDVDGIHFDDYFYVYPNGDADFPGITNQDDATFAEYNRGFTNRAAWRRDNVNLLVEQVYDSINTVKPWVKFGISPFGIWKSGTPQGIWGLSAYDDIYCDALAWLDAGTVDYIAPQLYWPIDQRGQEYDVLAPWWADQRNGRHLYVGQIFNSSFSLSELQNQVAINRATEGVYGNILFRATHLVSNTFGFPEYLATDFHRYPSLLPVMDWGDVLEPNPVKNMRYERLPGQPVSGLNWDFPDLAVDGDSISRSVVYRFTTDQIDAGDLEDPQNMFYIGGHKSTVPREPEENGPYYYVVTSLDRNWNESTMSDIVMVPVPVDPVPLSPADMAAGQRDSTLLIWQSESGLSSSHLQVSETNVFDGTLYFESEGIRDSVFLMTGLASQSTYYWRVKTTNAGGISGFSEIYSFNTGEFPIPPVLAGPEHRSRNTALELTFSWQPVSNADRYRIQIADEYEFPENTIVFDSTGITDTTVTIGGFEEYTTLYWHVQAYNDYGYSTWSEYWRFRTGGASAIEPFALVPENYELKQNYPNPFNPVTHIAFSLPQREYVTLQIFNVQGQLIQTLLEQDLSSGRHQVDFDGSQLPSGVYLYRIQAGKYAKTKKMMLIK